MIYNFMPTSTSSSILEAEITVCIKINLSNKLKQKTNEYQRNIKYQITYLEFS